MENLNDKESFQYTYSAKEQEELRKIRQKYTEPSKNESKIEQLRRLDASVTQKATRFSLTLGIIGALVLGCGMSLTMTDIGELFWEYSGLSMLIGIIVGIVGIVLICLAYPLYNKISKKERAKIAPEVLRLTDELMK